MIHSVDSNRLLDYCRVEFTKLDTKHYYIPHTRTRGYLFATAKEYSNDAGMPAAWLKLVKSLARPSSSPLEAFLLEADDPRVHQARQDLAQAGKGTRWGRTDWDRCESRHQKARYEEHLGQKRLLAAWEDGSICTLFTFSWHEWGRAQTERVLDLMDISYMRLALKDNVDACYKTLVWNLSQNVDRTTGSGIYGVSPCLTPSVIPYVTNHGGSLIGALDICDNPL